MQFGAVVSWERGEQRFTDNKYSRRHTLQFDGGARVTASSSPHIVPVPMSDPAGIDPEEAFVASIASCHMLFFLGIAAKKKFRVDGYRDQAQGEMAKGPGGKIVVTTVTLRPHATFSGESLPSREDIEAMHHEAHDECFIANSVKTEVRCEPVFDPA